MSPDFRTRLKLAGAALVAAGAIAGGIWHTRSRDPAALARAAASTPAPAAKPTIALPPVTIGSAMPGAAPGPAQEAPAAPAPSSSPSPPPPGREVPEPSAPPLEDVIERAMRGVVMIETQKSRGSGFFVRSDLIVTNTHVIAGFTDVSVTTQSGTKLPGRVAQISDEADVALVQVGRPGSPDGQLPLGSSATLRLGQGIVALGWAQSLAQRTVARGIVTGLRRVLDRPFLQTDAAPNPGDSGGPVMNRQGEVVGITTLRADDGSAGYAVPIDDAKAVLAKALATAPGTANAAGPGGANVQRRTGAQQYAAALGGAARRAADLDDAWSRYKAACHVSEVGGGQSHEWFNLYDPRSPLHRTAASCVSTLTDVQREADAISGSMLGADEAARRADVYPGTRRELRRRLRLDYSGWER
jgi:S1-C subfamily serine protease